MRNIQTGAVLYAMNHEKLALFYEALTDLTARQSDEISATLESESFQLLILRVPEHIAASIRISDPPTRREDTPVKLVFYVKSIDSVRAQATVFGGQLDPSEREWEFDNHKVCDGHDPEGNVFQLRTSVR